MDIHKIRNWRLCAASIILLTTAAAFGADLRLVNAVKDGDKNAVQSLLKQHADVNSPQPDGATPLAWAAHRNDVETAELLIRAGANVNTANDYGVTPLWIACTNGSASLIEMLLKAGANPNATLATGETALMTTAGSGNADAVKILLDHGADVNAKEPQAGQTALMWAVAEKHPAVVKALIEHKADIGIRSKAGFNAFLFAAQVGDIESARLLLAAGAGVNEVTPYRVKSGEAKSLPAAPLDAAGVNARLVAWGSPDGMNPLLMASASGREDFAIFLLENGADPNVADGNGITSLHYTVRKGLSILGDVQYNPYANYLFRPSMLKLMKVLLARGANPNVQIPKQIPEQPFSRGSRLGTVGMTPFLLAAAEGNVAAMRILVEGGANPLQATSEAVTPLMVAAGMGRFVDFPEGEERMGLEAAKLALELGADINAGSDRGQTALHAAAHSGVNSIAQFLVEKGANVNAKDKLGQTPWTMAEGIVSPGVTDAETRDAPHKSTAELLLKLGAYKMTAKDFPPASAPPKMRRPKVSDEEDEEAAMPKQANR